VEQIAGSKQFMQDKVQTYEGPWQNIRTDQKE